MTGTPSRIPLLALTALLTWSCGGPHPPPEPGEARGAVPDLRGFTVMVLPVQLTSVVSTGLTVDPEIAHALRTRGDGVTWVFPPEMDEMLQRSPGLRTQTRGLPVHMFLQGEVNRIGDPLFGEIVRLATLTGADVALIPVELTYGAQGTYMLRSVLIETRTGRVIWDGVTEGRPGDAADPAALASAAESLARSILPFG